MAGKLYDTLVGILETTFQVEPELISADATLSGLELDSLALAELAVMVQEQFVVTVTSEEVGKGTTLGELADIVDGKRASVLTAGL
ncbi:acyl carrier protein [Streptomyces sp. NPDC001584]|uniref:acyl carrier protein n=1 Tax=Streptomyces sp. NPDC001584 TaxID=3154521 RepID=UPI0033307308